MYDFIYQFQPTIFIALAIYFAGGLLFLHGDKRIRWYAFSGMWALLSGFNLPFYAESCVLIVAFLFAEQLFKMYSPFLRLSSKKTDTPVE